MDAGRPCISKSQLFPVFIFTLNSLQADYDSTRLGWASLDSRLTWAVSSAPRPKGQLQHGCASRGDQQSTLAKPSQASRLKALAHKTLATTPRFKPSINWVETCAVPALEGAITRSRNRGWMYSPNTRREPSRSKHLSHPALLGAYAAGGSVN